MTDDEITPSPRRDQPAPDPSAGDVDRQISALTELVGALAAKVTTLTERLDALGDPTDPAESAEPDGDGEKEQAKKDKPAPWVWFSPPAAADDQHHRDENLDQRFTLDQFVAWYNVTYVGPPATAARAIPACWRDHPGLTAEVATLAFSWRAANLGRGANIASAQYWHHTWRTGFAVRLNDWVHPRCLDGNHQAAGAAPRPDLFTIAEQVHDTEEEEEEAS